MGRVMVCAMVFVIGLPHYVLTCSNDLTKVILTVFEEEGLTVS